MSGQDNAETRRRAIRTLTSEEADAIIDAMTADQIAAMDLAVRTGVRAAVALLWDGGYLEGHNLAAGHSLGEIDATSVLLMSNDVLVERGEEFGRAVEAAYLADFESGFLSLDLETEAEGSGNDESGAAPAAGEGSGDTI